MKGSFTGANQQKKGNLSLLIMAPYSLMRLVTYHLNFKRNFARLENRVIQRVGGLRDIPIDVRIVTATHKNLQNEVNNGNFRLDLFYN